MVRSAMRILYTLERKLILSLPGFHKFTKGHIENQFGRNWLDLCWIEVMAKPPQEFNRCMNPKFSINL